MSAGLGMWEEVAPREEERSEETAASCDTPPTTVEQFADEQTLSLIRGLFLAGPTTARQVVFSGVGEDAGSSGVCLRIADALASQTKARVCLVETRRGPGAAGEEFGGSRMDGGDTPESAGAMRASPLQLRRNLWMVPASVWRGEAGAATLPWMRRRLGELRAEFEYAVIHAPPVGGSGGTEMLARLTDGLVLVLEAHRTRRVLARVIQRKLQAGHVPVLGAVLNGRTFPIPERLYRRV